MLVSPLLIYLLESKTMSNFIVNSNAQPNGDHEVHDLYGGCSYLPDQKNQVSLGWHSDCYGAVREANNRGYSPANGCYYCARPCHTG